VDPGPPVGQVEVRHVQGQELVGASGGLIEQPPQGSLSQRKIAAGKQPLQLAAGESPGAVDLDAATFKVAGRIDGEPASAAPPADCGPQGGQLSVQVAGAAAAYRSRNQPATFGPDSSPTAVAGLSSATKLASEAR
jgi:hypothetical protein